MGSQKSWTQLSVWIHTRNTHANSKEPLNDSEPIDSNTVHCNTLKTLGKKAKKNPFVKTISLVLNVPTTT